MDMSEEFLGIGFLSSIIRSLKVVAVSSGSQAESIDSTMNTDSSIGAVVEMNLIQSFAETNFQFVRVSLSLASAIHVADQLIKSMIAAACLVLAVELLMSKPMLDASAWGRKGEDNDPCFTNNAETMGGGIKW
jgi:hypothetical protein